MKTFNSTAFQPEKLSWRKIFIVIGLILSLTAAGSCIWPAWRELVGFGLMMLATNIFVAIVPHEPAFFYYARLYSPELICLTATLGCCAAAILDYLILGPLAHHPQVRRHYEKNHLAQQWAAWFSKAPFWTLTLGGFIPLPFYPFKFLSLSTRYPLRRFLLALIAGRAPRFYLYAIFGYFIKPPNGMILLISIGFILIPYFTKFISHTGGTHERNNNDSNGPASE